MVIDCYETIFFEPLPHVINVIDKFEVRAMIKHQKLHSYYFYVFLKKCLLQKFSLKMCKSLRVTNTFEPDCECYKT